MDLSRFRYDGGGEEDGLAQRPAKQRKKAHWEGPLPPLLRVNLVLVFVGFNPGLESARVGHYYAHRSNRFWKFLRLSGLVDRSLISYDDWKLPDLYRYGFTDLVARSTRAAHELSHEEMAAGVLELEERIEGCAPERVCFVGKGIWEAVARSKGWSRVGFNYGLQQKRFGGALLWVVPSTSGLNSIPAQRQIEYWVDLRNHVRSVQDPH